MHVSRVGIRTLAVGVAVFALVAVAAGGVFAASNPATLYACYDASGNVRMADTATCKLTGGGRLVSWSTVVQPGPTGAAGATGATGPAGPTGAIGPTGPGGATLYEVRDVITINPGGGASPVARCNDGDHVTGGGFSPGAVTYDVSVTISEPLIGLVGWHVLARNDSSVPRDITAIAICAH
jgi:hypothetical protein